MTRTGHQPHSEGIGDGKDVPKDGLHKAPDGGFAGLSSTPEEHARRAREGGEVGRRHSGDADNAQSEAEPRYSRPAPDGSESKDTGIRKG